MDTSKKSGGALVAVIIVIVILVIAGFYFWGSKTLGKNSSQEASVVTSTPLSPSDDVNSIEGDLKTTNNSNVDTSNLDVQ